MTVMSWSPVNTGAGAGCPFWRTWLRCAASARDARACLASALARCGPHPLAASLTNGVLGAGGAILFVPLALYVLPALGQVAYEQVWLSGLPLGVGALAGGLLSAAAPGPLLVLLT